MSSEKIDKGKRNTLKYAIAAVVAAAVAGGGGYAAWQATKPKLGPTPTTTPSPTPEPTPTPSTKEPIIIGQQIEQTGFLADYGYWLAKTFKATCDKINAEGGIDGRPIKYVIEDTQSDPTVGTRKLRKLILDDEVNFVIGSVFGGVATPSTEIAGELKTIYMPIDMTYEITADMGNRYIYRFITQVRSQVEISHKWALENIGKKWAVVVQDQAWGWSHREWWTRRIEEEGGTITAAMNTPIGTQDFIPYLSKIPMDTDGIYFEMTGADTIGFLTQLKEMGYEGEKLVVACCVEALDIAQLGDAINGTWVLEYLPRRLEFKDTEYNRMLRALVNVDEEGFEIGNPDRVNAGSHYWGVYESLYFLKDCIESSGWKSREDDQTLIKEMESKTEIKESEYYPQGDAYIRAEDHQGFFDNWMSRVENGKLVPKFKVTMQDAIYPAPVDYTKYPF